MEEMIEKLATLFRQRDEIDKQIYKLVRVDDPMPELKPEPEILTKRGHKRRLACPECGSRGWKHKTGCSKPQRSSGFLLEPKTKSKKEIHGYICRDCNIPFKSNLKRIDAFCPECRSVNIDDYQEEVITSKQ